MRVFLSYRRSDTGGRAGRLYDGLTTRLGERNVFQDAGSIMPGVDFERAVEAALGASDATLVVIGRDWASSLDEHGQRRLERPDDFVRREVATALRNESPVVPVLVDGAQLPPPESLPDDLAALSVRQAVTLGDATWHEDVDGLVRRLEGEIAPPRPGPRRRRILIGAGAAVAALVTAIVLLSIFTDEDGGGSTTPLPTCETPTDAWKAIPITPPASGAGDIGDHLGRQLRYTVSQAAYLPATQTTVLQLELANVTDGNADPWYFDQSDVGRLFVDGLAQEGPTCFGIVSGDPNIDEGQRAIALVGWHAATDPVRGRLTLETRLGQALLVSNGS